jgi:hypothetical protein
VLFSALLLPFLPGQIGIWTIVGLVGYIVSVTWRLLGSLPAALFRTRGPLNADRLWRVTTANSPESVFLLACVSVWLLTASWLGLLVLFAASILIAVRRLPNRQLGELIFPPSVWLIEALVLAAATGGIRWTTSDQVPQAIPQVIAIQLALTVVPLTLAGIASQVVIAWMGFRGTQAIPLWWIVSAFVAAICSLGVDVWLVASTSVPPLAIEQAETMAVLVVTSAGLAVAILYLDLAPERIVMRAVHRLNIEWLEWVVGTNGPGIMFPGAVPRDRFYPLERLMYLSAIREGEVQLFSDLVTRFTDRIEALGNESTAAGGIAERRLPISTEAALDVYLAQTLSSMLADAGRLRRDWPLGLVIRLRRSLEGSRERTIALTGSLSRVESLRTNFEFTRGAWDLPAGEHLYAAVTSIATVNGLEDTAASAARGFIGIMLRTLESPPPADNAMEFGNPPLPGNLLQAQADGFAAAHGQCFRAIRSFGLDGVTAQQPRFTRELARSIASIIDRAAELQDANWAEWFLREACSEADSLVASAAGNGFLAYYVPLQYGPRLLTSDPVQRQIAATVSDSIVNALATVRGLANVLLVLGAASFAQRLMPNFPEEAAYVCAALTVLTDELQFDDPLLTADATQRRIAAIRRGSPHGASIRFSLAFRLAVIEIRRRLT